MIYTEDREAFERDIFEPRLAAMFERAGRYTSRMSQRSSVAFFELARVEFWKRRNEIVNAQSIFDTWEDALRAAALSGGPWWLHLQVAPYWRPLSGTQLLREVR